MQRHRKSWMNGLKQPRPVMRSLLKEKWDPKRISRVLEYTSSKIVKHHLHAEKIFVMKVIQ